MSGRKLVFAALCLGIVLLLWIALPAKEKPRPAEEASKTASGAAAKAPAPSDAPPSGDLVGKATPAALDVPQKRAQLATALRLAREKREARPASDAPTHVRAIAAGDDPRYAALNIENKTGSSSDWELRQLETLKELLGECYGLASEEEPGLAGTIGIRFTVEAEPLLGGLVDDVAFLEEASSIENPSMRECMRESMFALELDPPPEGVKVGREVTLRFGDDA